MNQTLTITKYDNRKLYSKDLRKYVNHGQLIELMKEGVEVRFENKQGDDITNQVQTEIVKTYLDSNIGEVRKIIRFISGK